MPPITFGPHFILCQCIDYHNEPFCGLLRVRYVVLEEGEFSSMSMSILRLPSSEYLYASPTPPTSVTAADDDFSTSTFLYPDIGNSSDAFEDDLYYYRPVSETYSSQQHSTRPASNHQQHRNNDFMVHPRTLRKGHVNGKHFVTSTTITGCRTSPALTSWLSAPSTFESSTNSPQHPPCMPTDGWEKPVEQTTDRLSVLTEVAFTVA